MNDYAPAAPTTKGKNCRNTHGSPEYSAATTGRINAPITLRRRAVTHERFLATPADRAIRERTTPEAPVTKHSTETTGRNTHGTSDSSPWEGCVSSHQDAWRTHARFSSGRTNVTIPSPSARRAAPAPRPGGRKAFDCTGITSPPPASLSDAFELENVLANRIRGPISMPPAVIIAPGGHRRRRGLSGGACGDLARPVPH